MAKTAQKKIASRKLKRKGRKTSALLSHAAFAKLAGCTGGRITQVIRSGLVIEERGGKINPNLRANREWAEAFRHAHNGKGRVVHVSKMELEGESRADIERRKAIAATEKLELQNAETRRELIRAEDDKRAWAQFYSVLTSELLPLFAKLGPELAAALGVHDDAGITKVQELGDAEIFRLLEHAKSVMDAWLEEIDQEPTE